MPRYINVNSALQAHPEFLNEQIDDHDKAIYAKGWNDCNSAFYGAIKELPTVSPDEVRGVVHCKDCKWCHAGYCEKHDDIIPWGCANKPWEDWFCADGKRREAIKEAQDAD